jgi:truncated hemoglobin YjbI
MSKDPITAPFFADIGTKKKKHQQMMLIGMIAASNSKHFSTERMKKVH